MPESDQEASSDAAETKKRKRSKKAKGKRKLVRKKPPAGTAKYPRHTVEKALRIPRAIIKCWARMYRPRERPCRDKSPVKWQEHPFEGFVLDNQGCDHSTRVELVLDDIDRFLGLRVSILANVGPICRRSALRCWRS